MTYSDQTIFSTFAANWPHLGARAIRTLTDAVTFRTLLGETVRGAFLGWAGVPVVVTDRAAYVQWPCAEEAITLDEALVEAARQGLDFWNAERGRLAGSIYFAGAQATRNTDGHPKGVEL